MSQLEDQVKPILQPLMRGKPCTIMSEQQLTISRWMLKTVIMYEYGRGRATRYFKPRDRTELFEARAIPSETFIYLSRYVGTKHSLWASDAGLGLAFGTRTPDLTADAYTMTLVINQLALQIFSFRRPKDNGRAIRIKIPGPWHKAHVSIWPISGNRRWPPSEALDDHGLDLFAQRWATITPT
jgi:hypothetical protein